MSAAAAAATAYDDPTAKARLIGDRMGWWFTMGIREASMATIVQQHAEYSRLAHLDAIAAGVDEASEREAHAWRGGGSAIACDDDQPLALVASSSSCIGQGTARHEWWRTASTALTSAMALPPANDASDLERIPGCSMNRVRLPRLESTITLGNKKGGTMLENNMLEDESGCPMRLAFEHLDGDGVDESPTGEERKSDEVLSDVDLDFSDDEGGGLGSLSGFLLEREKKWTTSWPAAGTTLRPPARTVLSVMEEFKCPVKHSSTGTSPEAGGDETPTFPGGVYMFRDDGAMPIYDQATPYLRANPCPSGIDLPRSGRLDPLLLDKTAQAEQKGGVNMSGSPRVEETGTALSIFGQNSETFHGIAGGVGRRDYDRAAEGWDHRLGSEEVTNVSRLPELQTPLDFTDRFHLGFEEMTNVSRLAELRTPLNFSDGTHLGSGEMAHISRLAELRTPPEIRDGAAASGFRSFNGPYQPRIDIASASTYVGEGRKHASSGDVSALTKTVPVGRSTPRDPSLHPHPRGARKPERAPRKNATRAEASEPRIGAQISPRHAGVGMTGLDRKIAATTAAPSVLCPTAAPASTSFGCWGAVARSTYLTHDEDTTAAADGREKTFEASSTAVGGETSTLNQESSATLPLKPSLPTMENKTGNHSGSRASVGIDSRAVGVLNAVGSLIGVDRAIAAPPVTDFNRRPLSFAECGGNWASGGFRHFAEEIARDAVITNESMGVRAEGQSRAVDMGMLFEKSCCGGDSAGGGYSVGDIASYPPYPLQDLQHIMGEDTGSHLTLEHKVDNASGGGGIACSSAQAGNGKRRGGAGGDAKNSDTSLQIAPRQRRVKYVPGSLKRVGEVSGAGTGAKNEIGAAGELASGRIVEMPIVEQQGLEMRSVSRHLSDAIVPEVGDRFFVQQQIETDNEQRNEALGVEFAFEELVQELDADGADLGEDMRALFAVVEDTAIPAAERRAHAAPRDHVNEGGVLDDWGQSLRALFGHDNHGTASAAVNDEVEVNAAAGMWIDDGGVPAEIVAAPDAAGGRDVELQAIDGADIVPEMASIGEHVGKIFSIVGGEDYAEEAPPPGSACASWLRRAYSTIVPKVAPHCAPDLMRWAASAMASSSRGGSGATVEKRMPTGAGWRTHPGAIPCRRDVGSADEWGMRETLRLSKSRVPLAAEI